MEGEDGRDRKKERERERERRRKNRNFISDVIECRTPRRKINFHTVDLTSSISSVLFHQLELTFSLKNSHVIPTPLKIPYIEYFFFNLFPYMYISTKGFRIYLWYRCSFLISEGIAKLPTSYWISFFPYTSGQYAFFTEPNILTWEWKTRKVFSLLFFLCWWKIFHWKMCASIFTNFIYILRLHSFLKHFPLILVRIVICK